MKLPYGYVLIGNEVTIHEENANVVRSIFEYYLAGASLGKIVDMLFAKGILSPTGNLKWTRAAVDKLLANAKYIPIIGMETYMDVQFERGRRCNVDYDKAGHPRKAVRYQSSFLKPHARLIKSEGVPGGSHAVKGRRAWRTSRMTFCDEQTRTAYEQPEQICAKNLRFCGHSH